MTALTKSGEIPPRRSYLTPGQVVNGEDAPPSLKRVEGTDNDLVRAVVVVHDAAVPMSNWPAVKATVVITFSTTRRYRARPCGTGGRSERNDAPLDLEPDP